MSTYDEQLSAARYRAERDQARQELARLRGEATTMSAYDLLSEEEREALRWVGKQGGLNDVKSLHDNGELPLRDLCDILGLDRVDTSWMDAFKELEKRLMPEGMEWPRYESGEPVRIGGEYMGKDGKTYTAKQIQFIGKCFSLYDFCDRKPQFNGFYGESVKRPAVFAADGNRIEPAMDVWWICEGDERGIHAERLHVESIDDDGMVECSPYNGGTSVVLDPAELYVKKPVLDANGVPIKVGDTVRHKGTGEKYRVFRFSDEENRVWGESDLGSFFLDCSVLTHTKPDLDTWERIEEDARGLDSGVDRELFTHTHEDLVRRCRALAGVSE